MMLRFAFENTPAHVTSCWIADWNKGALHFVTGHGFQQAGRMRRAGIHQGKYYDVIVADLLRSEWQRLGGGAHAP
jgi:RimJ/RimL family protein N-acetyltransferase